MSNATQDKGNRERFADDPTAMIEWDDVLARVGKRWQQLTPNDLASLSARDFLFGNYEGLVGRVRERYGKNETEAQREVTQFVQSFQRSR